VPINVFFVFIAAVVIAVSAYVGLASTRIQLAPAGNPNQA
jgi:hypothetical protein